MEVAAFVIPLHALGAVIWVGGMFFAYVVLRPSLASFEPPARLKLWNSVFELFFVWVWGIVILLLATGYFAVFNIYGGFGSSGSHIHIMHVLGLVMMALFVLLYTMPYGRFRAAVAASDWEAAAGHLNTIRRIIAVNLALGLTIIAVATSGAFWF